MRFLVDTNTLSETVKPAPDPNVWAWYQAQPAGEMAVSAVSFGEIRKGLELLGSGERKRRLSTWLFTYLPRWFAGRVLPVDTRIALEWGVLAARARRTGRHLETIDGLLIATAQVRGLTLVTRNERDCADWGVPVLNPWTTSVN